MFSVHVDTSMRGVGLRAQAMEEKVRTKVAVRALNRMGKMAQVAASKEIRAAGYNLKAALIKKHLRIIRAKAGNLVVVVRASGKPVPLINFGARQNRKGVSVKVLGKRKLLKGAFIATMPTGHTGVFVNLRTKKHTKMGYMRVEWVNGRARSKGLQRTQGQMKERFGPSIPKAFVNEVVQAELAKLIKSKWPELLRHEARYELSRQ